MYYTYTDLDGSKKRGQHGFKMWDTVQSRFQAPWTGQVTKVHDNGLLTVVMLLDKRGKPIRKRSVVVRNHRWFKKVENTWGF